MRETEHEQRTPPERNHWRGFRRLMALMAIIAVTTIGVALAVLRAEGAVLRPHFVVALTLGIGVSLLLAGALMGLVFVSARSGHDATIVPPRRPNEKGNPWGRP